MSNLDKLRSEYKVGIVDVIWMTLYVNKRK